MSFLTILWLLTIFWTAVYSFKSRGGRSTHILPTTHASSPSRTLRYKPGKWNITIENLHLRAETTSFNSGHERLSDRLSHHGFLKTFLRHFYNAGVLFGVAGFLAGIFILGLSSHNLISKLLESPSDYLSPGIAKRELEGIPNTVVPSHFTVKPIIPGVTVPWSHLPVLLLALFVAQCIHEAGHAFCAALDNLPLHSVGFSVTLALPSAFVALSPSLNLLKHTARLRVIAAGTWHNLILWATVYFSTFIFANSIWTFLGWRDVSDVGRIVLDVDVDSPLRAHIETGYLIYALDDTPLSIPDSPNTDIWEDFLLGEDNTNRSSQKGFCVQRDWYQNQTSECCSRSTKASRLASPYLSCFIPTVGEHLAEDGHCVNPVPILSPDDHDPPVARCFQAHDCGADIPMQCVVPDADAHLTRISVGPPLWWADSDDSKSSKVVLWKGPRSEIWDEVSVGILAPRSRFIPIFFPGFVSLFFDYLATLSLSLYLFNLFCLPFLDGSHFFSALLDFIGGAREPDETSSPLELDDRSDHWLLGDTESQYSFDGDLESGSTDQARRYPSPSPHEVLYQRNTHAVLFKLSLCVQRCKWEIRSRKHAIELVVRVCTVGLIGFVILGLVWTQQWKATEL